MKNEKRIVFCRCHDFYRIRDAQVPRRAALETPTTTHPNEGDVVEREFKVAEHHRRRKGVHADESNVV